MTDFRTWFFCPRCKRLWTPRPEQYGIARGYDLKELPDQPISALGYTRARCPYCCPKRPAICPI